MTRPAGRQRWRTDIQTYPIAKLEIVVVVVGHPETCSCSFKSRSSLSRTRSRRQSSPLTRNRFAARHEPSRSLRFLAHGPPHPPRICGRTFGRSRAPPRRPAAGGPFAASAQLRKLYPVTQCKTWLLWHSIWRRCCAEQPRVPQPRPGVVQPKYADAQGVRAAVPHVRRMSLRDLLC